MHHRQRKPDRHCGIHGVAARLHHLHSRVRRQLVHADHHGVLGVNWDGWAPEAATRPGQKRQQPKNQ